MLSRPLMHPPPLQSYSYPAAWRIGGLAAAAGAPLEWRPFLLGPVFRDRGWADSPFNIYPTKGRYMWRDLERVCGKHGLPFRHPSQFPRQSLLAARVAYLALSEPWAPGNDRLEDAIAWWKSL